MTVPTIYISPCYRLKVRYLLELFFADFYDCELSETMLFTANQGSNEMIFVSRHFENKGRQQTKKCLQHLMAILRRLTQLADSVSEYCYEITLHSNTPDHIATDA